MLQINSANFPLRLLCDGVTWGDGAGPFGLVPRPKWSKLLPPDEQNRVPMQLWSPLIEIDGLRVLVDCGCGDKNDDVIATQYDLRRPEGTLLDDLARAGLATDDIDLVILTHLHGDHSGWATRRVNDAIVPTFSKARYVVQHQEYHDATHPNERTRNTYFPDNFTPLLDAGVLTLLEGAAQLTPSIRVVPTPGHCLGHQSVIVETPGNAPYMHTGDLSLYAIHFARNAWVPTYDVFPMTTIESKRTQQQWALEHNALLTFSHDTQMPAGRLVRNERGFVDVQRAS
ncbi:MAG: MBL fold metallo-hydrolase [Chloroflexi bacterium]|nr:MBL fold metallo-hydrolase [Chloroflexota bacterium]